MWQYNYSGSPYTNELYHYGVKGMRWGYTKGHRNGLRTAVENADKNIEKARVNKEITKAAIDANTAIRDTADSLSGNGGLVGSTASSVSDKADSNIKELTKKYVKQSVVAALPTSSEVKNTAVSILSSLKNKIDEKITERHNSRISYTIDGVTYKYNKETGEYEPQ